MHVLSQPLVPAESRTDEITQPGDTLAYTVSAPTNAPLRLELQGQSGRAADTLVAELLDLDAGSVLRRVVSRGDDPRPAADLDWWETTFGGHYQIRVHGKGADDLGRYTVRLLGVGIGTETIDRAFAIGDTVSGESIDFESDVDELGFSGEAGDRVILAFQSMTDQSLRVEITDSVTKDPLSGFYSVWPASYMEEATSGAITLPRESRYKVRVAHDRTSRKSFTPSPYRLWLYRVNPAPESAPAQIAVGDTSDFEALNPVGDVDEFHFHGEVGQELTIPFQLEKDIPAGLAMQLCLGDDVLVEQPVITRSFASLDSIATDRFRLPATGEYTVRVSGIKESGPPPRGTGRYRFELYPVDRRPEGGSEIQLDTAPVSEAIERPGDIDEFALSAEAGQLIVINLETDQVTGGDGVLAELIGKDEVVLGSASSLLEYAYRITAPYSGSYLLRVRGLHNHSAALGPYSVEAYTVSPAPEHVSAKLEIGQTVTGESIDRPGDLDVFTLSGQAGREVSIFLGWPESSGDLWLFIHTPDNNGPPDLFTSAGTITLDGRSTGRVTLKQGEYTLTVDGSVPGNPLGAAAHGNYAFRIFPIDHLPEGRSAEYALGDTVAGEPIYPAGDVDEYTFTLAEESRLRVFWDGPAAGPTEVVLGSLMDEQTGKSVWNNLLLIDGEMVHDLTLGAGQYRMVVKNPNAQSLPTLTYRFALQPE